MPIYEFACSQCGFYEEKIMKVSDPLSKICPKCKEETFEKLLSKTNFVLKGQGWYETDFKKPRPSTSKESSSASSSEASSVPSTQTATSKEASKPAPSSSVVEKGG